MYLYEIKCLTTEDFYIGSTNNFQRRKYEHTARTNRNVKNECDKLYNFIRLNGGLNNFEFKIIKTFENIDKEELVKEEDILIRKLKPTLNAIRAYNSKEDYDIRNRQISAKYRKKNPEKIKEYFFMYNKKKVICSCGAEVSLSHIRRHEATKKHLKGSN
tara:strand:- start:2610 stop:3086 length:477 start_codon:yes stop_codon:yes gene_type:complete